MFNVKDINGKNDFKTSRSTNPLEPSYSIINENGNKETIGQV